MPSLNDFDWNLDLDTLQNIDAAIDVDKLFGPAAVKAVEPGNAEPTDLDSECIQGLTPADRRAHSNRLAQRRSRVRKQALAQGAKAQLAINSAELQELQNKQKALEARNNLLEKVVQLGQKQQQQPECTQKPVIMDLQYLRKTCNFTELPGPAIKFLASKPALKLTVHPDREQLIVLKDFPSMPLKTVAIIYTEYVNISRQLLPKVHQQDSEAIQQLDRLMLEFQCFTLGIALSSPGNMLQVAKSKWDDGTIVPDNFQVDDIGHLAALQFTASQADDLMYLRRIYHGKVAQLDCQRKDILEQMSNAELELMRQDIRNKQLEELMGALQQNSMAVYRTHLQYVAVMYDGLYTPEQYAAGLVQAYPYTPPHKESLEVLAAQQGEPSIQELRDEILDDAQHAANWDVMVNYLSTLTVEHKQHYNPLPR